MRHLQLLVALLFLIPGCARQSYPEDVRYVSAPGGLKLRTKPGLDSDVLLILPKGTRVVVSETSAVTASVDGKTAPWVRVSSGSTQGWAFAGFLEKTASVSPSETPTKLQLERESCGCPGGCGYWKVTVELAPDGKVHVMQWQETDYPTTKFAYEGRFKKEADDILISSLALSGSNRPALSEDILSDFRLTRRSDLNGYIPSGAAFFASIQTAASDPAYAVDNNLCAFVQKNPDSCGTKNKAGYFCQR